MKSTFTISTKLFTLYLLSILSFSSAIFAQTATVTTNKSDYTPGQTVIITGTNWQPGETVKLTIAETPLIHPEEYLSAVADAAGNIYNNQYVIQLHDIGQLFTLTATGLTSGYSAQSIFTDSFGFGVAPVISPTGGFRIDGTLNANTNAGDWLKGSGTGGYVLNDDGSVTPANAGVTFHLLDKFGEAENNFAGGLKVNDNPNNMTWVTNTTSNKTDINNGIMHFSKDANGHQWVIVAADRLSNNGTAYIDFEFLQNTLDITGSTSGGFTSEGPDGGRTVNDFILTLLLTQGGSSAGFFINRWEASGGGFDYIDRTTAIPEGSVFAAVNTADGTPVSFGAFGNTTYAKNTFSEAAIDLTALLGAIDPCTSLGIKTIFIKTKVSSSSSAGIADFITPLQVSLRLGVANAGEDQSRCASGPSTDFALSGSANPSPGDSILSTTWSVSSGNATITNPNSLTTAVAHVTSGAATIVLTVTTQKGCTVTDTIQLTANASSNTCLISGAATVCPKSATTYSAPVSNLSVYKWTVSGNATISGADNQQSVIVSAGSACSESYTLSLKITDANGCFTTCEKVIKVEDVTAPVIESCPANITLASNSNCEAVVPDFTASITASDNCTAANSLIITQYPTAGSIVGAGTTKVTITVKDACNKETTCETNLIVTNYIVANDDIGTTINGFIGGTAFANVLTNDFLNCQTVNAADVNLSPVNSTNDGITLSGTSVMVAAGTPAGSYSLTYKICEKLNPDNCDTATVTVSVTAPLIDAVNDNGSPTNGFSGGTTVANVLVNDTLNGQAVLASQVNTTFVSSTNSGITLSGTSVVVAAGTPAGSYSLIYKICEILNPMNCDTATVTVSVSAPAIDAVNDIGSPVSGFTGGTAVTNVLINDTLNGQLVLASQVNTAFVSSTNSGITLSGTNVLVAAGTPAGSYTLVYSICEILNPDNCDTATVTVSVSAASIVATDDTGNAVNGLSGGTAFSNVLVNDTLNGAPVMASQVTTTFVSSTNAGVTLSGVNVVVAPRTPNGSYSLVYKICEILNPGNCDTATVSVLVNAATIVANDDSGSPVNGFSGGTAASNVLINDTINGQPVLASQVNTTFVSSTNAGITLSGNSVLVSAGTPAGSYSLIYKICEILNPDNCDTATVTVSVTAPVIDAVNDSGSPINGFGGGTTVANVLVNDTLNGQPVLASQVNTTFVSSTNSGITLSGASVVVAAGTPAGSYSLIYKICEILNPMNCDTATVTITVTAPVIDAVNDSGSPVNGFTGGTPIANVLINDTLNGQAVLASQVNTSFVSSTNSGITLSGTSVLVAAGTPAGSYSLIYKICEILNPDNCDTATVSITVTAPAIDAVNDNGSPVSGFTGGTAFTNVLINDTLNGQPVLASQVNTAFVSSTNSGITLSGTNVLVAAGTPAGSYTLVYSICEILNPDNCDTATVTVSVSAASIVATDDTGNAVNGLSGGTAFSNVLVNDTLNGAPVMPSQVTTTFVSSTNVGVTLAGVNVVVAPGTPNGSYSLVYKICEILNPGNCDTATVSVLVNAATIVANDDSGSPVNGFSGGTSVSNVLINDTLNGQPVLASQVNTTFVSSTNAGVTLSGNSVLVSAGTPAGSYSLIYKICEILNPDNCDTATVTVSVTAPVIDAVNDSGSPINGFSGGTTVANVLVNDTLNGQAVLASQVNTTFVSSTNAGITLSGASVVVAAGTPAGSYSLIYKICEILNPMNCDTATVTVSVSAPAIDAVNDIGSPVNGFTGGTPVANVLINDTLNGQAVLASQVNTSFVSSTNSGITLSGTSVLVAAGTPTGSYSLIYKICEILNPDNCDTATVSITVTAPAIDAVNDNGSPVSGFTGGTAFTNVLINDTLNGQPVLASQVNTAFVSSTNSGITLSGNNVLVAAGTPAGSYTLVYSICEILNPNNCDQASVTINVFVPSINLLKDGNYVDSASPAGVSVGDIINYTFTVTNGTGSSTLTNVTVIDPLVTVLGGPIVTFGSGAVDSTTFTATYSITQADIDAGQVNNLATVSGTPISGPAVSTTSSDPTPCDICTPVPNCPTCTSTPLIQNPKIALLKTASVSGTGAVGDVITYTFSVKNTGNVTLSNIVITDPLIGLTIVNSPIAVLAPGATSTTVTGIYTITQADKDAGKVTNSALAVGQNPNGGDVKDISGTALDNDTPTITLIPQKASIALVKTASVGGTGAVGDIITYTFSVTNTGNVTISNILITDPLVGLLISNNQIASLAPGATNNTITGTYTITQADKDAGNVTNSALAVGQNPNGGDVKDISGTALDNDTPTVTPITQNASIALVKTASVGGTGAVGDLITYTFAVTNTGNVTVTNIVITDPLIGLTISNSPIATLAPGNMNSTVTGTYIITQADKDAGKVTNSALAVGQDPNGGDVKDISGTTVENDTPTVTPITQNPGIALVKTASVGGTGAVGDVITYTFSVKNTGNVVLTNIVITDPLIGLTIVNSPIATLAPGVTNTTVTGTYTITQADIDEGSVTNSALAAGQNPTGGEVRDTSGTAIDNDTPTVTPLTQTPGLEVIKTSSTPYYSSVGDIINYTIQIKNTGNVTLNQIVVKDPLTGLDEIIASLSPGSIQEYTQDYIVTQEDRINGSVTNIATATGKDPDGNSISDEDTVVVEAQIVLGCGTVTVHNAFSPNGDGINEVFTIDNIDDTLCYPDNSVAIYNRWGVLVYETSGYNNTSRAFKGISEGRSTISQSSGLPTGTYFYILNYTSIDGNGGVKTNTKDGYLYLTKN